jgi:uncharacterized protein
MSADNRQIIADVYANFAKGDAPAVLASFAPDIVWNEAENFLYADRNPYQGPQAVAEGVFGRILTEFADFQVTPDTLVADDGLVVALGRYTGTYNATSRPVNAQFVHVWTLRDGRIVGFQQYTDTLQFARATRSSPQLDA